MVPRRGDLNLLRAVPDLRDWDAAMSLRYHVRCPEKYFSGIRAERMESQIRPRIGITMRLELETDRFYLARFYSEAVEAAGGLPVHIALIPNAEYVAGVMAGID